MCFVICDGLYVQYFSCFISRVSPASFQTRIEGETSSFKMARGSSVINFFQGEGVRGAVS